MPPRRNQSGYSLIELMVVIGIIALLAGLAVPGLTRGLRERRKTRAAHDVVRVFQTARRFAIQNGRAYLVRVSQAAYSNRGSIEVYRGDAHRCNFNDWEAYTATACADNLRCIRDAAWDPNIFETTGSRMRLSVISGAVAGASTFDLCYDGVGVMWWRATDEGPFGDSPLLTDDAGSQIMGAFEFQVDTVQGTDDEALGVTRRVLVPFGAEARYLR